MLSKKLDHLPRSKQSGEKLDMNYNINMFLIRTQDKVTTEEDTK